MIGFRVPKLKNNEAWALCSLCLCGKKSEKIAAGPAGQPYLK
ncbi:MAG: hypothetical protein RL324_759 [Verrucomicrobiota bacterium]|jgi:hypothetical protein